MIVAEPLTKMTTRHAVLILSSITIKVTVRPFFVVEVV